MAAQDTLQKLWLRGKAGGLAPREQLKAWALREAWQDTGGARGLTMAALPKHTRPRQPARPPGRGVGWGRGGGGVVAVGGWSRSAEKAKPGQQTATLPKRMIAQLRATMCFGKAAIVRPRAPPPRRHNTMGAGRPPCIQPTLARCK